MKKMLFVSFGLETSDTSAAIRNRRLVSGLSKHFEIHSIEFCAIDSTPKYQTECAKSTFIPVYSLSLGDNMEGGGLMSSARLLLKRFLKQTCRCVIPDKLTISAMTFDFSSLAMDVNKFSFVLTSSDPQGVQFVCFNRSFRERFISAETKLIQYWGDPWFQDINLYTNFMTKYIEGRILSKATAVIYNSLRTLETQKLLFKEQSNKFRFLSRGISEVVLSFPDEIRYSINSPRLLYAGDYRSISRNIEPLVQAVTNSSWTLTVLGYGDTPREYGKNIIFKGRVDSSKLPDYENQSDILIVIMNKHGVQVPGKLYDYAASRLPIIVLTEGGIPPDMSKYSDRFIIIRNEVHEIAEYMKPVKCINVSFRSVKNNVFKEEVKRFVDSILAPF